MPKKNLSRIRINDTCRISADDYNFTVEFVKKNTWKSAGHYGNLGLAVLSLTDQHLMRASGCENMSLQFADLVAVIERVKSEILQALK